MSAEKPVWHSNVASGDITFDELAQAAYEAYRRSMSVGDAHPEPLGRWDNLSGFSHTAWRQAVMAAHRMIVRQDQEGEPHAQ
jgi:hypothetical protein